MSSLLKKEKGFTLIEIVLVLAIAGLLLMIVFLAVSGAQKNRRDTQRKQDNARLMAQIEEYASNNQGTYPPDAAHFTAAFGTGTTAGTYSPQPFTDPTSGSEYTMEAPTFSAYSAGTDPCTVGSPGQIFVYINGRQVDSVMCLEQGFQDLNNH